MAEWGSSGWIIGLVALVVLLFVFVWGVRGLSRRSLPASLEGVKLEVMAPVLVDDRVVDADWEIPFVASNPTRRPRCVPILSAAAQVKTERARYRAVVEVDDNWEWEGRRLELNPEATAVGRVRLTLPGGQTPRKLALSQIRPKQYVLHGRLKAPYT
ncbi:hypothetical protein [Microbacterium sp. NPDC080220]|uniref:hypothetical protein n=1 Tax=Microbacterium sp. NPDC080220 TaxID=3161017 RepID=UPI0034445548